MIVTKKLLLEHNACKSEVERFAEIWPDGVKVTYRNGLRALREGFDIFWFAGNCLPAPLWKTYMEAVTPFWQTYEEAIAPFFETYMLAKTPLWEEYEDATTPFFEEYEKVVVKVLSEICK